MSTLNPLAYLDVIARTGSIPCAAEVLSITSTALNRRLLALESELGSPLFERLSRGVRLSPAGEVLVDHIRRQSAEVEHVLSQMSELKGERHGRVVIACSQAFLPYFLPAQIAAFRQTHPGVVFTVLRREREAAERALLDHSADIAMVVEPVSLSVINAVAKFSQNVHAVFRAGHPLAEFQTVRLEDCLRFPVGLPTDNHGVRQLFDLAVALSRKAPTIAVESDSFDFLRNYRADSDIVTFQMPIGLPNRTGGTFVHRPIDQRDLQPAEIFVGHLWGRSLPTAAASFLDQVGAAIGELAS